MNVDHNVRNTVTPAVLRLFDLNRFPAKEEGMVLLDALDTLNCDPGIGGHHQIVGTARELRISRSAVSRGMSSISAVAPMMRSAGSLG